VDGYGRAQRRLAAGVMVTAVCCDCNRMVCGVRCLVSLMVNRQVQLQNSCSQNSTVPALLAGPMLDD
jgi:hypothetical protein